MNHYSEREIKTQLIILSEKFPIKEDSIFGLFWISRLYLEGKIHEISQKRLEWALNAIEDEFMHLGEPFPFLRDLMCEILQFSQIRNQDPFPF